MRIRYHELIGKPVRAADGAHVGRVTDLIAERQRDTLCVTALLIGPAGLARRISFKRASLFRLVPARTLPWTDIARVADAIHLRPESAGPQPLPPERSP
jgi:sporulation protein YlmC with PRC-barrel domain